LNGGCCKTIQIVHKLNWLGLFEKYIKIMKIVNYKDNLMAPVEQYFPHVLREFTASGQLPDFHTQLLTSFIPVR
jgi:hypothetical protein